MKKILIIGTGPSGLSVLETLKNKKCEIDIVDGKSKSNFSLLKQKNLNISPKYNNPDFLNAQNNFIKKYLIKTKNFFLSSSINEGGGTSYWGSGLEIPDKKYYEKNNLKPNKFNKFYKNSHIFFNRKPNLINKFTKKEYLEIRKILGEDKYIKINHLRLATEYENNNNKVLDKLEGSFFNSYNKINKIYKKNIKYKNFFVTKIKKNKKFKVFFSEKNFKNYDLIFCCAGTIGSTIIVSNLLDLKSKRFRIFHNPMFLLIFLSLNPFFFIKNLIKKTKIALPGANLVFKSKDKNYKGSIMILNNITLSQNTNFLKRLFFNLGKNFLIGGNFFLDQNLSKSYITKKNKYFEIKGENIKFPKNIKNRILSFFKKKFFIPVPFLNLKPFTTGSDAHYTSTIYNYNKKNRILNENNELIKNKNFYILDGSIIPPGLNYPTFFTVTNNFKIMKNIIKKLRI